MHGDDEAYGSVHRVELFDKFPRRVRLTDVVEHHEPGGHRGRALAGLAAWCSKVLRTGPAPSARDQKVVDLLDDWVRARRAAARRRRRRPLRRVRRRRSWTRLWRPDRGGGDGSACSGDLLDDVNSVRGLSGLAGESYVDKDLRTLLGVPRERVAFNLRYCGEGSLRACRDSLWIALHRGRRRRWPLSSASPIRRSGWQTRRRTGFQPGLIPNTMRDHEPPDVPAGARAPAPVGLGALGPPRPSSVELEPREAAAVGGGLAPPAVGEVLDQQQPVAPVGVLDALRRR